MILLSGIILPTLFLLSSVSADVQLRSSERINDIKNGAFDFIMSKRDNSTYGWKDGQTAIAVLGLLGARPSWDDKESALSIKQLQIELLSEAALDPKLNEMDSASLAAYGGVFLAACYDTKDLHGFDFLSIMKERLLKTSINAPAYGALALVLCNDSEDIRSKVIQGLDNEYKAGKKCPYCVETSAIRLQALLCLLKKEKDPSVERRIQRMIFNNRRYLKSTYNDKVGTYGSVLATAVASRAMLATSDMSLEEKRIFAKSRNYLFTHHRKDGSFDGSLQITATVISVLSSFSVDQAGLICAHRKTTTLGDNEFKVKLSIKDDVYTEQHLRFSVVARRGESMLSVLNRYTNENPETLKLAIRRTRIGPRLVGINELNNDRADRTFWRLYLIEKSNRNKRIPVNKGLDKLILRKGFSYLFSYELL